MVNDMAEEKFLSQLTQGQEGIVKRVKGAARVKRRLQEMGFVAGAHVHVAKFAPLKDPAEYVIRSYHVSLRRQEAAMIVLEPDVPTDGE